MKLTARLAEGHSYANGLEKPGGPQPQLEAFLWSVLLQPRQLRSAAILDLSFAATHF